MQHISDKIQSLLKSKDLKQQALAKAMDYEPHHLSKKFRLKSAIPPNKLSIAATFLGVTETYLRDTTRPFHPGDEIPPDAIATPPTPIHSTTPSDLAEMVRIFERQAADIARSDNERMKIEIASLRQSDKEMAQVMKEALGKLAYIAEIVRELKDERDGGHDPDWS